MSVPANRKHHAVDTAARERWQLLGRLFRVRRVELGYRYRPAFAEARLPRTPQGNLMVRALNAIENGERPGTYAPGTLEMYARAYEVTVRSVYAVLRGDADELVPAHATGPLPVLPPRAPESGLVREDADYPYFRSIWERLLELAGEGNSDPTGEQLGLSPEYADFFDSTRGAMSRSDRAWAVADVQRRREARSAGPEANAAGA